MRNPVPSLIAAGLGIAVAASVVAASFGDFETAPGIQTCPPGPNLELGGINVAFWSCNATLAWNAWLPVHAPIYTNVSFHGARFSIYAYLTAECPAVDIRGVEPDGSAFEFEFAGTPMNCTNYTSPVFTPALECGAMLPHGDQVVLLVRTS